MKQYDFLQIHKSPFTTKVFMTLAFLPLLMVAVSGIFIYTDLISQTRNEALLHIKSSAKLLSNKTDAYISNRTHSVKLMAGKKILVDFVQQRSATNKENAKKTLRRYCAILSASICYIMDRQGFIIADSRPSATSVEGNNYGFRDYFIKALKGRSMQFLAVGATTFKRGLYFSEPIYANNKVIGVAVIKFLPDELEKSYRALSGDVLLVDSNGVIFATSKPSYLLKSLYPISETTLNEIVQSKQFGSQIPANILQREPEESVVKDTQNNKLLIGDANLSSLPGWKIVYLLSPGNFQTTVYHQRQIIFLAVIVLFFLIVLIMVSKLFFTLKHTLKESNDYRSKLEESKKRLQQFEEITTEAIIIHNHLTILDFNKRCEELLQCCRQDLLEYQLDALFYNSPEKHTSELLLSGSEKPYRAVIKPQLTEKFPVIVTHRPIRWNGRNVQVTFLKDERRHEAVKQQLQDSESRFRQLSELVSEGILIFSKDKVVDANNAFCSIFGVVKEDLLGTQISELFPEYMLRSLASFDNVFIGQELELPRKDGTHFHSEISAASMAFEDGIYTVLSVRDITRQKEQESRILYQAQYDFLTDIPNRFLVRDKANKAMTKASRLGNKVILMFIDLDGFKKINDSLGHDVGDVLLQLASRRFEKCLPENATLARHGGDEFLILMENVTAENEISPLLKSLIAKFSTPFVIDNKELIVTASIGVAVYPSDGKNYSSLLRAADIAMYRAKSEGRNRYHFYTQELNNIALRNSQLDNDLRFALERQEFYLVFQPLVSDSPSTRKIIGAEALLRWDSQELGIILPDEFIPLTESTGLIIPIGRWILTEACKYAKYWIDTGFNDFSISVNVSPRQFYGNDIISDVKYALEKHDLHPKHLNLEVTEGLLFQASTELEKTLAKLSSMGVKLSMDDFGTGYSSLSYLQNFPFNNLKIDRAFIKDLPTLKDSKILVTAIIAMSHELGLSVTAEGIETKEQLSYVNSLGCDVLQGYFISQPLRADEFTDFLKNTNNTYEIPYQHDI